MVVSNARDLLFIQSGNHTDIKKKSFSEDILALSSDEHSNIFILQYEGQNQMKLSNLTFNTLHIESIYFPYIPGVNRVLPYKNGYLVSNQTQVFQVQNQNYETIYQGKRWIINISYECLRIEGLLLF